MNYYGFQQIIKLPTHRIGGLLYHFYTNIGSESTGITFNTIPTYYSDHILLSIAILVCQATPDFPYFLLIFPDFELFLIFPEFVR